MRSYYTQWDLTVSSEVLLCPVRFCSMTSEVILESVGMDCFHGWDLTSGSDLLPYLLKMHSWSRPCPEKSNHYHWKLTVSVCLIKCYHWELIVPSGSLMCPVTVLLYPVGPCCDTVEAYFTKWDFTMQCEVI